MPIERMSSMVTSRVADFIIKRYLLQPENRYLVALSGGADSVCMLLVLKELGYSVEAVHCNFHLRGEESERDEQFCVQLCREMNVELHRMHFETEDYAHAHGVSIEMAARELRYRFFCQLNSDLNAGGVCVAHHQDDVVETVIMNMVRGTGIHGLTGIEPRRTITVGGIECPVIRPLLCVTKQEITGFLNERHQPFVTDSTNLETNAVRNKIRLEVLPLLREINPSVNDSIFKTSCHLSEAVKVFDDALNRSVDACVDRTDDTRAKINIQSLMQQPSPEYTLHAVLSKFSFVAEQVETVHQLISGSAESVGRTFSSHTHQLLIDRDCILVEPLSEDRFSLRIPETGLYVVDHYDVKRIRIEKVEGKEAIEVSRSKYIATLDAANIKFPLTVRTPKTGDRFHPFGLNATQYDHKTTSVGLNAQQNDAKPPKLLSDFLTDCKLSLFEKRRQLVVTDASDRILWVVGRRTDHRFRITENTSSMVRITVIS